MCTLPRNQQMAPENQWLEDEIPVIGWPIFKGLCVKIQGVLLDGRFSERPWAGFTWIHIVNFTELSGNCLWEQLLGFSCSKT